MIVPLTLADFLERAEHVYGGREAVVDEPDPPGGGLGRVTYTEFAAMARSLSAALDDLGVGENGRVAIVSPNVLNRCPSARLLRVKSRSTWYQDW
ncbi:MAG TPA: AMP-binding protein [Methylomirabilota bacterium]